MNNAWLVWDYMLPHEQPVAAECIVVLGSCDDRVASYAAELVAKYTFGSIVIMGSAAHQNDLLRTLWDEDAEAENFTAVMVAGDCL